MDATTVKAWAKINLTLDVLGKRPDGYHELSSIMQAISLHDEIEIRRAPGNITLQTNCPGLPTNEHNLAYKGAAFLLAEYGINQGIHINLQKRIPVAAGLAGGSSNCAAVLLGLNSLLELNIPIKHLMEIGRKLGADVPFCLLANAGETTTALAEGIGEKLTPLPAHPNVWIVLARLPVPVSTKTVFERFEIGRYGAEHTPAMLQALKMQSLSRVAAGLGNMLTDTAAAMHPQIRTLMAALVALGALGVNMTGSGPTVFAYFLSEEAAYPAVDAIKRKFSDICDIFVVTSINSKSQ